MARMILSNGARIRNGSIIAIVHTGDAHGVEVRHRHRSQSSQSSSTARLFVCLGAIFWKK